VGAPRRARATSRVFPQHLHVPHGDGGPVADNARPTALRRLILASRSQIAFDSVALRLTTLLLKLGKVAKPGHLPDTSTMRP
jgi:hypothetical protein